MAYHLQTALCGLLEVTENYLTPPSDRPRRGCIQHFL